MADIKISELGAASAVNNTDLFPITSNGVTVKATAQQIKNYMGVGNIADLNTTDKSSTVAAINEVNGNVSKTEVLISNSGDAFSSTKAYAVGDYVIYNNVLYCCITNCSAGSWATNQSCFTQDTLVNAVDTISGRNRMLEDDVTTINNATGHVRFAKRNGIVTMAIDVTPSDASTTITFNIPSNFKAAQACYDRWTSLDNKNYCYFYPNNPLCSIAHTNNTQISRIITFIAYTS